MSHKIALLSNINMNFVLRMLKKTHQVYETEGYGNELGLLLDKGSGYHVFAPDTTFLIMDLLEVLEQECTSNGCEEKIERWFRLFETGRLEQGEYYISDAYLWGVQTSSFLSEGKKQRLEHLWNTRLQQLCERYRNVHVFSYHDIISKLGEENSFSLKTWYMGKILHTAEAQKRLGEKILHCIDLLDRVPKKVLLLDLDNTLWGGIAGEHDISPIILSDDHEGLAYKNLQRVIALMRESGVILGIVSKNNEEDALSIIRNHPHMILREEDFVIRKINWEQKNINITQIASELNLGLDSFVFFDDNPTERELIKQILPMVEVPDFPDRPEELAGRMCEVYHEFFEKPFVTAEDLAKTRQYAEKVKRDEAQKQATSFEEYLKQLQIEIERVDAGKNLERLLQLVNKTNQFNLTTRRYTMEEIQKIVEDACKRVYLYRIEDCFGDYGIVCAVIVDVSGNPMIEEFVLSCRVMGKYVEYGIVSIIEKDLAEEGYEILQGMYIPTAKNKPVEQLYYRLGYEQTALEEDGTKRYQIEIPTEKIREYYATFV
ncbi:MAG: HAD-IIIC family phosphatase [Lachnospiraceae bacterium]|nr:HAD-IIIC family phosphatase [Lachnospiraceae bacterium]